MYLNLRAIAWMEHRRKREVTALLQQDDKVENV
jgi:hypothetical protein